MNAFISEWLVYLGLIQGGLGAGGAAAVFALMLVGVVSLVGGLAVLCFVRLVGVALLGEPRSEQARHAHESPISMTAPMALLALASVVAASAPQVLAQTVAHVTAQLEVGALAPDTEWLTPISVVGSLDAVLWLAILGGGLTWKILGSGRAASSAATWGCGYGGQAPRAQYTALSFAQLAIERILPKRLRPRSSARSPGALFPGPASLSVEYGDPMTRDVYEPFLARWGDRFDRLRWVQQGMLHIYLAYVLAAALAALAWSSLPAWLGP
jgi:NADH:ubiquinone oxidoreductase subunit 5 (subunit L)/multisubunit Na+/H+ antiporter MnhA subunit